MPETATGTGGTRLSPVPKPESGSTEVSPAVFFREFLKRRISALQDYSRLCARAVTDVFTPPLYVKDILTQMDAIGVGSLPIVLLTSFSIGAVMVLQTSAQFTRFGETALTGDVVALALVREIGPILAGLLVTGRNGSGIASELGSMVVTEQVDAMRALGTDPYRKLVTPRMVAAVLTLPLLTVLGDLVGLIGGYVMASTTLHLSAAQFWNRALRSLDFGDIVQGMVKPLVFAFLLSTIACFTALRVRGGTEGVGRATTSAVVASSVCILIVDFFITRIMLFIFQ
jgi:phospholipid/cholesterol/gamma-HCH transport system permease protein